MTDEQPPAPRNRRSRSALAAYVFMALFALCALLSVGANLAGYETVMRIFAWGMGAALPLFFLSALIHVNREVRGWPGKLFTGLLFISLGTFIAFAAFLIIADALYINKRAVIGVLTSRYIRQALWLSISTSLITVALSMLFAIPMGYALSRYRFPGHVLVDTAVDLPIVFPPLVAGLTLLVFFSQTAIGNWIQEDLGIEFVFQPKGIVLCQFLVSASFAIRSAKSAFDEVDTRLEKVALTLGCTRWGSFFRISLPMAAGGITGGAILTWARAFGIFGPLMIFVGSFRGRTEVLSTSIFLEQSVGNLEAALAVALLLILVAMVSLVTIRLAGGKALVKL
jgi:molybdate transport system permease protein